MQQARIASLINQTERPRREVSFPKDHNGQPLPLSDFYGCNVFSLKVMQSMLPKPVFNKFLSQMKVKTRLPPWFHSWGMKITQIWIWRLINVKGRQHLDRVTADAIAHAVRVWAQGKYVLHSFSSTFAPILHPILTIPLHTLLTRLKF